MHQALPHEKISRSTHFTTLQVLDALDDSDNDVVDIIQEYDSSDVDLDIDCDKSSGDDGRRRGRVPQGRQQLA